MLINSFCRDAAYNLSMANLEVQHVGHLLFSTL